VSDHDIACLLAVIAVALLAGYVVRQMEQDES
jgi:hypothetical protein